MISQRIIRAGVLTVLCGLAWGGCSPSGPGATDEEKEPQFLIGRSRVNAMDFGGAIEAFERALETNPQSAAAHLELGWLYAEKNLDPAAAIYHYEQFLRRKPMASEAEMIRKQILGLKQKLAEVEFMPSMSGAQKKIEELTAENRQLRKDLEQVQAELAKRANLTNTQPARILSGRASSGTGDSSTGGSLPSPNLSGPNNAANPGVRIHKVLAGDTPTSIARRYSIKVDSLLAANPGLNPKRLRVDQTLTIPGR